MYSAYAIGTIRELPLDLPMDPSKTKRLAGTPSQRQTPIKLRDYRQPWIVKFNDNVCQSFACVHTQATVDVSLNLNDTQLPS